MTKQDLNNSKIYVGKHSKEIQEKLFELGFEWRHWGKTVRGQDYPFLYLFDGVIQCGVDMRSFNENPHKEITYEELMSISLKPQWEDFGEVGGYYINSYSEISDYENEVSKNSNRNLFPTKEEAEACLALSQLCQWRDKYNDGWKPDWKDCSNKCIIFICSNDIRRTSIHNDHYILAFKTPKIRDKFLEDFRELIEIAKPLL